LLASLASLATLAACQQRTENAPREAAETAPEKAATPAPQDAATSPPAANAGSTETLLGALPASFAGNLPCADCSGLHYHLDLRPEGIYFLRTTYRGGRAGDGRSADDIGRWQVEGGKLVLRGGRAAPEMFRIHSADMLRKLDLQGEDIASSLDYSLKRARTPARIEPQLRMTGMYSYMADAGMFVECFTGLRLAVAPEGDNAALERAYTAVRHAANAPVLARLEGRIAMRPRQEGGGEQEVLIVTAFDNLAPEDSCAAGRSESGIAGRDWVLVEVDGKPVTVEPEKRPSLRLEAQAKSASGHAGCNRYRGPYTLEGGALRFGPLVATKMACPHLDVEGAFLRALESTERWQVRDTRLELLGANGGVVARLSASR
jgi:copper homeostasis protein (lipoprotein)